jgi:hypothetical protein
MEQVTIDFVTRAPALLQWRIVLVEEGPWSKSEIDVNLLRIQRRLYGCIDAALDGDLARQFSDSQGKQIVIHLDCYDVPEREVRAFFDRFAHGVFSLPDYKAALVDNESVRGILFEFSAHS